MGTDLAVATNGQKPLTASPQNTKVAALSEETLTALVLQGDLSRLLPAQKVEYYRAFCARVGLDPATQPFKLLKLSGKEVLYCDRSGTAQLNKKHDVSHKITDRRREDDLCIVTAQASTKDGRCTESIGAVSVAGLRGEALANAIMKAETKAKRRATLDLLGLGMLDESEIESIPAAQTAPVPEEKERTRAQELGHFANGVPASQHFAEMELRQANNQAREASAAEAFDQATEPKAGETQQSQTDLGSIEVHIKAGSIVRKSAENAAKPWVLYGIDTDEYGLLKTFSKTVYDMCGEACVGKKAIILHCEPTPKGPTIMDAEWPAA